MLQKTILLFTISLFLSLNVKGQSKGLCYPDLHNTSPSSAWLSCSMSNSPNPVRGNSYWIMYDLGTSQDLGRIDLWNYNFYKDLDNGVQNLIIDISSDGSNWLEVANEIVPQADGTSTYEPWQGPNINRSARYVLLTVASNYGGSCSGFSEMRIFIDQAPCAELTYDLYIDPIAEDNYHAIQDIKADALVKNSDIMSFKAGQEVILNPGFEVEIGADFTGTIEPCP